MSINVDVDIDDADRELRRLDDAPDLSVVLRLEALLAAQFLGTQQVVHIISGSLRASGKIDSEQGRASWLGEISYGGHAPGAVHQRVDYAQIEQGRRLGGKYYASERGWLPGTDIEENTNINHDFMGPVHGYDGRYVDAILDYLRNAA